MHVLFQNYAKDSSIWSVTFQQILDVIQEQIIILKLDVEGTECKVNLAPPLVIALQTLR